MLTLRPTLHKSLFIPITKLSRTVADPVHEAHPQADGRGRLNPYNDAQTTVHRRKKMAAYLLAVCEVTNPNENFKKYAVDSAKLVQEHGGKYLVRGPAAEVLSGDTLTGKVVILTEFPSMEALNGFVNDEKYVNEIAPLRDGTGTYHFASYDTVPPT
jgi:uncharacterized protein (DUF1330 family)